MGKDKWITVSAGTMRSPRWYVCQLGAGETHYSVQAECRTEYAAKRVLDAMTATTQEVRQPLVSDRVESVNVTPLRFLNKRE